jgi:hypothetical protein
MKQYRTNIKQEWTREENMLRTLYMSSEAYENKER